MAFSDVFLIVSDPVLSAMIWFVILTIVLYIARVPAHYAIISASRVLHSALRLTANSVMRAEARLSVRNREVLLGSGRDAMEGIIDREIERIEATVRRDLSEYPSLQRQITESLVRIEEDYKQSSEVPPSPASWSKAVESVAAIPAKSDPMVVDILESIHASLIKAHEKALGEYRDATAKRHELLKNVAPFWRNIQQRLDKVDKHVKSLLERFEIIGQHIKEYRDILENSDRSVRILSSSALNQFFISLFVLAVAIGGAGINFSLIARPMAEMVGGQHLVAGYKTADIAALVIILVEISMGLFLMESLRITRLFPVIGALNDKMRVRMIWITFSILFILASVEAGLAFMREMLLEDQLATSALLRGEGGATEVANFTWITTAAQMGMGFILPFALTFVAIPLETFVHSTRTVIGLLGVAALRFLAYGLRLLGNFSRQGGRFLIHVYDLLAFVPLWIERLIRNKATGATGAPPGFDRYDGKSQTDVSKMTESYS